MESKIDPSCVESRNDSRLKLEECGRKVVFLNPANDCYLLTRVDGCAIKAGLRADWLVSSAKIGNAVVELKGKDVGHAIDQVEATLKHLKTHSLTSGPMAAVIMCRQVPKAMTNLQSATDRMRKNYGAKLKVSSSQFEFSLTDLVPRR